jgi:hypothetical protein
MVKRLGIGRRAMKVPRRVFNVDRTKNKSRMLTHYCLLQVKKGDKNLLQRFYIISLSVRLKLAFCTTCAVRVLVLAQGPSFVRLRRALLRRKGIHKMRGVRRLLREKWRQSKGAVPLLLRKAK